MASVPHSELHFDAAGVVDPAGEHGLADLVASGHRELFLFAHGWNNEPSQARRLFGRFFDTVTAAMSDDAAARAATVGVLWPSTRWPDEPVAGEEGGAAPVDDDAVVDRLLGVCTRPEQQQALEGIRALLGERSRDPADLVRFQSLLAELARAPDVDAPEDRAEEPLLTEDPETMFEGYADLAAGLAGPGGAAGIGDVWRRIWSGAREALRATSYYVMKKRAGVIGHDGLGPLLDRLHAAHGGVRIHLAGHSFGARLVGFTLTGLPDTALGPSSPVASVLLVQGAFSHFAFAPRLPVGNRAGALAGMPARVDGPIAVTHSLHDLALTDFYPRASLLSGDDAAARDDRLYRWGAMGCDGAQEVGALDVAVGPVGTRYPTSPGAVLNVDCNALIVAGPPPSGAHSDVVHPELGHLAAHVAGLARPSASESLAGS